MESLKEVFFFKFQKNILIPKAQIQLWIYLLTQKYLQSLTLNCSNQHQKIYHQTYFYNLSTIQLAYLYYSNLILSFMSSGKEKLTHKNSLVNRLYKSVNKKHSLSYHPSQLPHIQPVPTQQRYLVPKIYKTKLKPIEIDSRMKSKIFSKLDQSFQFQQSQKNILEKSQISSKSPMIGYSKVRSKMYSIIDDLSFVQEKTKERQDTKQLQKMEKNKNQSEQKSYLTPNDFMEILKIDRQMSEQFCYMNKTSPFNSYDWKIVQFENREPAEYMVISKRGLTKYYHNEVEFIRFQQFLQQQKIYNRLHKISYYKHYHHWKYFQIWRKFTSMNIFRQRSRMFEQATLLADVYLNQMRLDIRKLCKNIQSIESFYTQTISSMQIQDFKLYAITQKNKTMNKIHQIQGLIIQILKQKSAISMDSFMKKMRITKQSKKANLDQKKVPLLIGDQTGKDMPYTQSATLRTHQRKIRNFLKFVDYLILTSKSQLIVNMVTKLSETLQQINKLFGQQTKSFNNYAWINVQVTQEDGDLYFSPNQESFIQQMEEVVYGTLADICNNHTQILHKDEFYQYWKCNVEAEKTDQYIQIKSVINSSSEFNQKIGDFRFQVKTSFSNLKKYSQNLGRSVQFIQFMRQISKMNLSEETGQFFKNTMSRIKQELKALSQIQTAKDIGIILLNLAKYKAAIQKQSEDLSHKIHLAIPDILLKRSKKLLEQIKDNYNLVGSNPLTIKQYITFLKNTNQVNKFAESTSPLISDNSYLLTLSQSYSIKVPENTKSVLGDANGQMIGLSRRLTQIQKSANDTADKFKKQIQRLVPTFEERLKGHKQKLNAAQLLKNNETLQKKIEKLETLSESLKKIINDKNQLRKFQQQLALNITQFTQLDSYQFNFKIIQGMWNQLKNWKVFYQKNWIRVISIINFQEIKKYLETLTKRIATMQRQLQPNQVVQTFKNEVEAFKPIFYSVFALKNPALKQKHFEFIRELIRKNFALRQFPSESILIESLFTNFQQSIYTFQFFSKIEIQKFKDQIIQTAVQAQKQAELLQMITQVQSIWRVSQMTVISYKEGKDFILGNNDQLITRIDDNLLIVNNILASKYVGPIKPRVEIQSKMLRYVQDLIDQWYVHQKNWIYLQPILRSPFALKNLPKESAMFGQIDTKWKTIMKQAKDSMSIKKYADEYSTIYTMKVLKMNNQAFQIVQKALQNFLQKKRDLFQRFYFLSNDELLQILSTVKTFQQIQPHLRKVFQNFVSIQFDQKGIPKSMGSLQGQVVQLRNCIFRGQVQEWFRNAQESMKVTLKSIIRHAQQKFTQQGMKRSSWIKMFPSQVVLTVDSIMWTKITQGYLQNLDENDINQWYNTNVSQLNELVQMIRTNLTKLQRKVLVALITQDVHFRDIVQSLQVCQNVFDFKWIQQLRFYNQNQLVVAKQVQAQLQYGYQYLGATTRLVITPLTDRCWMTITGALHIKLGANPAGPAGTGKTQSCKDLAKSLGRYCIVFNCSDQINAQMMQKLFSGLAFTGSWTCLDQFNRIDIQVLSVVAQQVLTIRQALLIGKHNRQLVLGGKNINLNHDIGIFITMNPGYAGRTQLPDNLKMLFRPVSMMVPDYTLIAQIMLFSEGFSSAKELSKKMTKLYKLSSQQLSQQDHYDFGMRAVKSVLVMAGTLKRQQPDISQQIILIRAMQDSNIPKFLSFDIPLFNGIIQDLFPNVLIPKRNQEQFIANIKTKCAQNCIISTDNFVEKILQLNQTLKVRFGVMLVGPPMSSKTSITKMLLNQFPTVINPKSVSLAELYGNFDPLTQTWSDGLAAKLLRLSTTTHQYVMFDGPVDAIWVQNLNTVLDDSMMLCLSNGQRIKLSAKSRILFQVMDLNQASPATVSRCGMVWVSEDVVQWQYFVQGFFLKNKILQNQIQLQFLQNLVKVSFKKGYNYIKKFCKQMVKVNSSVLIFSYCKFLKNIIKIVPQSSLNSDIWKKALQKICVFAFTWSVGAIVSDDSKSRLDKGLSDCFSPQNLKSPIANFSLTYADKPEGEWQSWNSITPIFQFPQTFSYSELFIPTKQNFCYSYIFDFFIQALDPIFMLSPTGTGKTSIMTQIMRRSPHANLHFTFTAQTSPYVAQIQLESKLSSQRKAGNITLIPPPGKKFIYFIDDISMPKIQQYGAQPPIQMLRLILSNNGVWDRKTLTFKQVSGVQIVIAGTYGRNELPPRFIRFFNSFYIPQLDQQSVTLIFSEITKGVFHRYKLKNEVMELIDGKSIVNSTINLYNMIRANLLPTPQKSHYLFNLRDVSKVIQGLTMIKPSSLSSPDNLVKLWVHEFQRIFQDRLTNQKDKKFIRQQLAKKVSVSMKSTLTGDHLFDTPIVFGNFFRKGIQKKDRCYQQSKQISKLTKIINDYMQDQTNMHLVLFSEAILHICRVSRCLIMQKGHILMVGLTGSGKQSAIMLGTVISQCELMTIQLRKNYGKVQFREDIFQIMKKAAFQNTEICFMFPQHHMINDIFLEDINNLLSSGQIPAMFTKQNMEEISQQMGYQNFVKKVIQNLHIGLTLSPVGDSFRSKIRNFPSLINCCVLDWVDKWPEQALTNVATMKLEQQSVINCCVAAHKMIQNISAKFYTQTKRKVFVTAKNYIQLIDTFNVLLNEQRSKLQNSISKLSNGVHKLEETNSLIESLKKKLTQIQPILQIKTAQQQNLLKTLEVDRKEAGQAKLVVEDEQKVIAQKTDKALQQKKQADRILNQALPTLHAANEALNTLNRNDISQIKMNQNPHAQVKFTLQCVAILLQQKQDWQTIRKVISDINFISRLKNLDVYHIPQKVQNILRAKLKTNPSFKPNQIKNINFAAKSFCQWVLAVVNFAQVNKQIVKKKVIVKKLNEELEVSNKQLNKKRNQLNQIISKLKVLETNFLDSKQQKQKLDNQIILTNKRLINAELLTVGLKNQKGRWTQSLVELNEQKKQLIGNTFLGTCFVVYLGPYFAPYREAYLKSLFKDLNSSQIVYSQSFSLQNVLGDNLEISQWINFGLPKDQFSINNGILVKKTSKNPLMIDPQLQASKWIKNLKKIQDLKYFKMGGDNISKQLQTALRMKKPILIEMPSEQIDASLSNLLGKQFEKVNNRTFVKIGENRVQVQSDLKVYLYTKLSNPFFSPQIFIKMSVINFTVTKEGLDDQLLALVVQNQLPEVQLKKRQLVNIISKGRITLQKNQDKILQLLNNSKGNILDDQQLIHNLKQSKKVSTEVKKSLEQNQIKSKEIQLARQAYKPIAQRGTILYMLIAELSKLDPMYQFSLEYFSNIFKKVLQKKQAAISIDIRVLNLCKSLTSAVFNNISRALFNQHKKIFSFMMTVKINKQNEMHYNFFNKGIFILQGNVEKPSKLITGLNEQVCVVLFNSKKIFQNQVYETLQKDKDKLTQIKENPIYALRDQTYVKLTHFEKLIISKIIRPEFTVQAMTQYIKQTLGSQFVNTSSVSMMSVYADTSKFIPLTFILSVGADPLQSILRLAKQKNKNNEQISIISLGQGQGPPAERALQAGFKDGHWVVLQNCHLGKSFLPTLQKKIQDFVNVQNLNQDFRLFLTSMPCNYFPVSILQNSLKVTSQPPRGIKSNLKKIIETINWGETEQQKTFSFNLCFFHSIVLERRKFGPLGWNILYDFNQSDLSTSLTIVNNLLKSFQDIPWDAIQYFVGEIVYGGRVTDQFDRRLLKTLLYDFISPESIDKPRVQPNIQSYYDYIEKLSEQDNPNLFGLNQNAQKTYMFKIVKEAQQSIMSLESQQASEQNLQLTLGLVQQLQKKLPSIIKKNEQKKYNDALQICIIQESVRFNRLIQFMDKSLKEIVTALKGQSIMTQQIQQTLSSISKNQVPKSWQKKAYPSIMPLASWYEDLLKRIKFFRTSINQKPKLYWISAFFFPQGFLTSILQIHSRKYKLPVDSLSFQFIFKQNYQKDFHQGIPLEGCLIYGMYSQACTIDLKSSLIKQSLPDVIDSEVPVIHFKPVQAKNEPNHQICEMPLYKTKSRAGTLSTTGHSTNYVVSITCKTDQDQGYWVRRGAAFFCSLQK